MYSRDGIITTFDYDLICSSEHAIIGYYGDIIVNCCVIVIRDFYHTLVVSELFGPTVHMSKFLKYSTSETIKLCNQHTIKTR